MMGQYTNPYYYWWKVRKYWKIPKIHLAHIGKVTWWYGLPICKDYYNKYFDIRLRGLGWKDKYNTPRFEWDPYLCFTLLRKWQLIFVWNFCPYFLEKNDPTHALLRSENTWEAILGMTDYGMNISDAYHSFGFSQPYDHCEDPNYYIPPREITIARNLTDYGFKQYFMTPRSKQLKELKIAKNYE